MVTAEMTNRNLLISKISRSHDKHFRNNPKSFISCGASLKARREEFSTRLNIEKKFISIHPLSKE